MNLINDGHLVGFWPMNEGSGAPFFRNYSSSYGQRPSGISFDLQVHITDTPPLDIEKMSHWPGREIVNSSESGTTYVGYKAQGTTLLTNDNDGPLSKVLILGDGGFPQRRSIVVPTVAQSGFTVGFWVNPQTDGAIPFLNPADAGNNEYEELSQFHALMGQYGGDEGFLVGVSGRLANDARDSDFNNYQLRAFAHVNTLNPDLDHLDTPIERERFTHVTFSYRYVDGSNNELALYRDGRLAASGTTAIELTNSNSDFAQKVLTVGGTSVRTFNNAGDYYEHSSGWGHLISGVYAFNRVLHEGEVQQLHDQGGFDIPLNLLPEMNEVLVTDPQMIAYYPIRSMGYKDVSKNHYHLFSDQDVCSRAESSLSNQYFLGTGPFGRSMVFNGGGSNGIGMAAGSGLMEQLLDKRSFTIGCWYSPDIFTSYGQNTVFSFGSIGTAVDTARQTGGFFVRGSETTNDHHLQAIIYHGGHSDNRVTLQSASRDIFEQSHSHVALAYDDQTFGVALYVNGELAQSGTLAGSMFDQNARLAYSGYPLLFGNGVIGEDIDVYDANGGNSCGWAEMFVMGRPMLPQEVRCIAASGIDTDSLDLTPNDPRLMGYWRCTDGYGNNAILKDSARVMDGAGLPGHLTRAISDDLWDEILASDTAGQFFTIDPFKLNVRRDLGVTSGVYTVMGGSKGIHAFSTASDERHTSTSSFATRFKMTLGDRDLAPPGPSHETIWSFEVTPSGDIPPVLLGEGDSRYNSTVMTYGEASSDRSYVYLTSELAAQGSGIQIVAAARDAALITPLASGNISYGDTSRVLIHIKPMEPNFVGASSSTQPLLVTMYINGDKQYARQVPSVTAYLWSNGTVNSTADDWVLQFGGRSISDSFTTGHVTSLRDGLGDICLRNIFIMGGGFTGTEIQSLATNGIDDVTDVSGYDDEIIGTTVINADSDLLGYWRFTGQINANSQSGVIDLSNKGNHLDPLSQNHEERYNFASRDNTALNLRFMPGPFASGLIPVQASGITYNNDVVVDANTLPPFAVSGAAFNNPNDGFSIGFWMVRREDVSGSTDGDYIVGYGPLPTIESSTTWVDASWAVMIDASETVKLCLSDDGIMPWGDNVSSPHVRACGPHGSATFQRENIIETFRRGSCTPAALDSWAHYGWTYNKEQGVVKAFLNGVQVDQVVMPASGFHVPLSEDAKMLTVYVPQLDDVWNFDATRTCDNQIMTDLFYFSRALTDDEMQFIAMSGMAPAATTQASGQIGGYIAGSDVGSGLLGGYLQGFDVGSGLIGGFIVGSVRGSGLLGGYIHASDVGSGLLGGFMLGAGEGSGLFGGYITGSDIGSGLLGALLIGSVTGEQRFDGGFSITAFAAEDFDAQVEIERTAASDFDARVVLFEEELPPDISIIHPDVTVSGLAPSFCQYFIGSGTSQQGKSVDNVRWTFGDFTSPQKSTPPGSGVGGDLYPIQHCFLGSGYFTTRFTMTDSDGITNSAIRIVDAASGVSPVLITVSGVPTGGQAPLRVQFSQVEEALPSNVIIAQSLLDFGDGQRTTTRNPIHVYNEPGRYIPIWVVRDSRGVIWSDTIEPGIDVL